jgi:hypothetical protein
MFSSIFSTTDPKAPTLHPVSARYGPNEVFGELQPQDTELLCGGGFITETQTFYIITEDGSSVMCQLIHSAVGVWFPTIQFVCKVYNPNSKEIIWKSVNVSNFVTPPPGLDKRSSKADEFSFTFKSTPGSDFPESYKITANLAGNIQISLDVSRPAGVPGFKIGKGEKGGYSYLGSNPDKADGYVIHRIWPMLTAKGHVINKGKAIEVAGPGMFVHAIQGMRPNLVAQSWNFGHFQSTEHGGCSAILMEFKTTDAHGKSGSGSGGVRVSVGSIVLGGKLASVTTETIYPNETPGDNVPLKARATHLGGKRDPDTTYNAPSEVVFEWAAPSLIAGASGTVDAKLTADVGPFNAPKGLIEKIDILGEIPSAVKMVVNVVAGAKPFMYQWINPAVLKVSGPDAILPGLKDGLEIKGTVYNEATFIS